MNSKIFELLISLNFYSYFDQSETRIWNARFVWIQWTLAMTTFVTADINFIAIASPLGATKQMQPLVPLVVTSSSWTLKADAASRRDAILSDRKINWQLQNRLLELETILERKKISKRSKHQPKKRIVPKSTTLQTLNWFHSKLFKHLFKNIL